ncbi:MAG: MarR family transcriptional regulator [Oscillospiraceae bacterium]|nr:MarR family transcriptional regulator [Oscillospiraceae bacterium]
MISKYELFSASVSSLYRDIQRIERRETAKYGMKGPHAQCLLAMSRYPEGITATQICDICEKDKAAVSRTLAELEENGLVLRTERNGSRYRALLTLTEKGKDAARTVNEKAQIAVELAGAGLDDAQREIFYAVLDVIAGNLHTICKEGLKDK